MSLLIAGHGAVAPPPPPAASPYAWTGLSPTWTGWDGSVWKLSDPAGGVLLARGGTRGLSMPPIQRRTSQSPALAGSRWLGMQVSERDVFWPLVILTNTGSQGFVDMERSFWRTMDPERPGVWSVTLPDGSVRSLPLRFVDDGQATFDMLPVIAGWAKYGVTLVADRPFWQGSPVVRSWQQAPAGQPPTFPVAGDTTYVLYLTSGATLATASVTNPGDVESYPVWTITGPCSSVTVGVSGKTITVPFPLADGQRLTLDTSPEAFSATADDGTDVTNLLGEAAWAPVPAGQSVPLSLSMVGSGAVRMELTPNYYRAW